MSCLRLLLSKAVQRNLHPAARSARRWPYSPLVFASLSSDLRVGKPPGRRRRRKDGGRTPVAGGAGAGAVSGGGSWDDYLAAAHLSPYVPTPEPVGREILRMARASAEDVHFELGSGDGRMNFLAVSEPFGVKRSIGIEVDRELVDVSRKKWETIFRGSRKRGGGGGDGEPSGDADAGKVQFRCEDLLGADSIDLKGCTVLTMYFVEDGLLKIRPALEEALAGSGCRVVTNGYAMPGWEARETGECMGLSFYLYVL